PSRARKARSASGCERPFGHLDARHAWHAVELDRVRAAAQLQRGQRGRTDIHAARVERALERAREQDLARARPLAEPRGDIQRIPNARVTHVAGGADVAGHHIALIDADTEPRFDVVALLPGA